MHNEGGRTKRCWCFSTLPFAALTAPCVMCCPHSVGREQAASCASSQPGMEPSLRALCPRRAACRCAAAGALRGTAVLGQPGVPVTPPAV